MLYCGQGRSRLLSVAAYHIESHLDVEHILGQLLERQQIHGLLVQFVHPLLSMFGCGLIHGGDRAFDLARSVRSQQDESQHHGGRMRYHRRSGLQFDS